MKSGIINGVHNGIIPQYNKIVTRGYTIAKANMAFFPMDMKVWLKSDIGVTASVWSDQSGNSNNLYQSTAINQPSYIANQLNGYPVLRFDGSNDYMEFASGFMYNWTDVSFFIIFKPIFSLNSGIFAPSNTYGTGIEFLSKVEIAEPIQLRINNNVKYTSWLFSDGTFTISDFTYNSLNTNAYVNGIPLAPAAGGAALNFNGIYALGRYAASYGSFYSAFDVAEIIIYNRTLTSLERLNVRNYLNNKYTVF